MDYNNNNTDKTKSQALLEKLAKKKAYNKNIINYLENEGYTKQAMQMKECGTYVGITEIEGIAKFVRANFCKQRICNVCSWRRQAKFTAQMLPVINILNQRLYRFIEVVLTVKSVKSEEVPDCIDKMLRAYNLLYKTKAIKEAWKGITRSIEITYNHIERTYHPHIHMLIAVESDYFYNESKYISFEVLQGLWQDKMNLDYIPNVYIKSIDDMCVGAVENIKYSLKPTEYTECIKVYIEALKGRRLISFNGVFAKVRKELKYSSIDEINIDDGTERSKNYTLYKYDATGGVYSFYARYQI